MHWSRSCSSRFFLQITALVAFAVAPPCFAQTPTPAQTPVPTDATPPQAQAQPPPHTDTTPPAPIPPIPNAARPAVIDKSPPIPSLPVQLRFIVVLDPGHGGQDVGAKLGPSTLEKDIVLSISTRLRALLNAKGVPVIVTRDGDSSPTADERAAIANRATAAACISLHATATGTGVHLFTTSLSPANSPPDRFIPWNEAQATFSTQSVRLASDVNTALGNEKLPVLLGRTALRPLNSFTCPAVAVELAPLNSDSGAASLTDSAYQERVAEALTRALIAWRVDWRQRQ